MPLRDDLLAPIPGANPSGSELRYDPLTDKIKEARREEMEAPQGAWKAAVKTADYPLVIKLAGDALASRSKDLQIAVWLIDAEVRREGFAVLAPCFRLLRGLCGQFWDTLYPAIEEDDLEMRAAPLDWLGSKLEEPVRLIPVTANGLSWFRYKESRLVGYEAQADSADKRKAREQAMNDGKISPEEFDAAADGTPKAFYEARVAWVDEGLQALEELTGLLDEKFGAFSPSFVRTRTALEDSAQLMRSLIAKKGGATVAAQAAPAPVAAPVVSQPVSADPVPVAAQDAAPEPVRRTASASGSGIDPVDAEDVSRRLAAIARYLRAKDVYDISAYLIPRGFRWGEIRYNGPDIDRGMLAGPGDELREKLARRFAAGDWDGVLALTEGAMETECGRAWLDLQRYTVKALESKSPYFVFVADAVRGGLRELVQDLPALLHMSLRDGAPAADAETRRWIEEDVLAGMEAPAAAKQVAAAQRAPEPVAEPLKVAVMPVIELTAKPPEIATQPLSEGMDGDIFGGALRAAAEGRLPEALKLMNGQLTAEHSGRGRFRRRVQLAHLLVAAGHSRVARPVLEEVAREIETRQLENWEEGEALAYPLSLLLRCLEGDAEQRSRLYAALCRLDPVRAMQIEI